MAAFTIFVFLCAVFCFSFSTQDKIVVEVNAQSVAEIRRQAEICEKETGVPAAVLKKIVDWPLDNNEPTKKFFHCVVFNTGYTDKDGHMIVDNMAALTVKNAPKESYIQTLKECNNITLENYLETLYAVGDCIHSKVKITLDG